jgi:hypothetical protein
MSTLQESAPTGTSNLEFKSSVNASRRHLSEARRESARSLIQTKTFTVQTSKVNPLKINCTPIKHPTRPVTA